jgi:hypothetical protein
MTTIHSQDEIPVFVSKEEEHCFWQHHEIGDALWDQMPAVPEEDLPHPRTKR